MRHTILCMSLCATLFLLGCGESGAGDLPLPTDWNFPDGPLQALNAVRTNQARFRIAFDRPLSSGDRIRLRLLRLQEPSEVFQLFAQATGAESAIQLPAADLSALEEGEWRVSVMLSRTDPLRLIERELSPLLIDKSPPVVSVTSVFELPEEAVEGLALARTDVINRHNVHAMSLRLAFGAETEPGLKGRLWLKAGDDLRLCRRFETQQGAHGLAIESLSLRDFADGPIDWDLEFEDRAGNVSLVALDQIQKDTDLTDIEFAHLLVSKDRSRQRIGRGDLSEVALSIGLASRPIAPGDQFEIALLRDGALQRLGLILAQSLESSAGGIMRVPLDLQSVSDGPFAVAVTLFDAAGNFSQKTLPEVHLDTQVGTVQSLRSRGRPVLESLVINAKERLAFPVTAELLQAEPGDRLLLRLSDGLTTESIEVEIGAAGQGSIDLLLDLHRFADGPLTILAGLIDSAENASPLLQARPRLDTTPPGPPLGIAFFGALAEDRTSLSLEESRAAKWAIAREPNAEALVTAVLTVEDGHRVVASPAIALRGALDEFPPLDLRGLSDGPLEIAVTLTDAHGNAKRYPGPSLLKDAEPPRLPDEILPAQGLVQQPGFVAGEAARRLAFVLRFATPSSADARYRIAIKDQRTTLLSPFAVGGASEIPLPPLDLEPLADGVIELAVQAIDAAGNRAESAPLSWIKDTQLPQISALHVEGQTPGIARLAFGAAEVNALRLVLELDRAAESGDRAEILWRDALGAAIARSEILPRAGRIEIPGNDLCGLADGKIALSVRLLDDAGNQSPPAELSLQKDTRLPRAPLSLSILEDAAARNPPGILNANNLSAFVAEVRLASEDAPDLGVLRLAFADDPERVLGQLALVPGQTLFRFEGLDASGRPDGDQDLLVTREDEAGNRSTLSVTVSIDTSSPAAPVGLDPDPNTGAIAKANAAAFALRLAFDEVTEPLTTAIVSVEDRQRTHRFLLPLPAGMTEWTLPPQDFSGVLDGEIAFAIAIEDRAGNRSEPLVRPFRKDTEAPVPPVRVAFARPGFGDQSQLGLAALATTRLEVTFAEAEVASALSVLLVDSGGLEHEIGFAEAPRPNAVIDGGILDWSAFSDGPIQVFSRLTDPFGNERRTSFGSVVLDREAPALPTGFGIGATAQNAADFVNAATATAATVTGAFGQDADPLATASLVARQGATEWPLVRFAPVPLAPFEHLGLDLSALAEGPFDLTLRVVDPAGNLQTMTGRAAIKDTIAPAPATALSAPAQAFSPANTVSSLTAADLRYEVVLPPPAGPDERLTLSISDGQQTVEATQPVPGGGGLLVFAGLSIAALNDGILAAEVRQQDAAGNETRTLGPPLIKQTGLPIGPTAVRVAAIAGVNAEGIVNSASATAARLELSVGAGTPAGLVAQIAIANGFDNLTTPARLTAGGAEVIVFEPVDLSGLPDGNLALAGALLDVFGNPSFVSQSATKDTLAPVAPDAVFVAESGQNPEGFINAATVTAVSIAARWPLDADPTAVSFIVVNQGIFQWTTPLALPVPGATQTYGTLDLSQAADGSIALTLVALDVAGNLLVAGGFTAIKDTTPPAPLLSLLREGEPLGPITRLDAEEERGFTVQLEGGGAEELLSDSWLEVHSALGGSLVLWPARGSASFGPLDLRGLAGEALTLSASIRDAAGNLSQSPTYALECEGGIATALSVDPLSAGAGRSGLRLSGAAPSRALVRVIGAGFLAETYADAWGYFAIASLDLSPFAELWVEAFDPRGNALAPTKRAFDQSPLKAGRLESPGDGLFATEELDFQADPAFTAIRDADQDGLFDLWLEGEAGYWRNLGTGQFQRASTWAEGVPTGSGLLLGYRQAASGDFGRTDPRTQLSLLPGRPTTRIEADFDHDGRLDAWECREGGLYWSSRAEGGSVPGGPVNQDPPDAQSHRFLSVDQAARLLALDLDQDGDLDLLVLSPHRRVVVLRNLCDDRRGFCLSFPSAEGLAPPRELNFKVISLAAGTSVASGRCHWPAGGSQDGAVRFQLSGIDPSEPLGLEVRDDQGLIAILPYFVARDLVHQQLKVRLP